MEELIILLGIFASVSLLGVIPVFVAIKRERKPSPWQIPSVNNSITQFSMQPPVTKVMNVPKQTEDSIVVVESQVENKTEKYETTELSKEVENTLANLLEDLNENQDNELNKIREKIEFFHSDIIANMVTAVPGYVDKGEKIVYGVLASECSIEFEGEILEICGDLPSINDIGENVIIKGNLLENGKFFSLHWEYPDMIECGYSEEFNLSNESLGA